MPIIRDTMQKIVNAAHLKWDGIWSPPVLHTARVDKHGMQKVSEIQLRPYELYEQSIYLSNPIYFKELQRFVLALWQLRFTTDPKLCAELMEKQESKIMTRKEILMQLTWLVQQSAPRFQLCWPSVK